MDAPRDCWRSCRGAMAGNCLPTSGNAATKRMISIGWRANENDPGWMSVWSSGRLGDFRVAFASRGIEPVTEDGSVAGGGRAVTATWGRAAAVQ